MKREEKEFLKKSKEIVKLIAKKELKENQIKGVDILPVTKTENIIYVIKERLKELKVKDNYRLIDAINNIFNELASSKVTGGEYYDNENKIKIYLSTIKKNSQ